MVTSMDIDTNNTQAQPQQQPSNKTYVETQYGKCELQSIRDDGIAIVRLPFNHTALMYANCNTLKTTTQRNKRTMDTDTIDEQSYVPTHKRVMSAPAYHIQQQSQQQAIYTPILLDTATTVPTTPNTKPYNINTTYQNTENCVNAANTNVAGNLEQRCSSLPPHCQHPMFV